MKWRESCPIGRWQPPGLHVRCGNTNQKPHVAANGRQSPDTLISQWSLVEQRSERACGIERVCSPGKQQHRGLSRIAPPLTVWYTTHSTSHLIPSSTSTSTFNISLLQPSFLRCKSAFYTVLHYFRQIENVVLTDDAIAHECGITCCKGE